MNARTSAFGCLLRQLREAAGLSQEHLAERAGLSLRGISDLERGVRTTPRLETVRMLADALGLDAGERAALLAARNAPGASSSSRIRRPSRLPSPSTAFIGRAHEIAEISAMLARPGERLVTLVGPGGVGKTRLALEVARGLDDTFPDGVAFAGLASIRDPELVLPTIATALGAPDSGTGGLLDLLSVTTRDRSILLLLDNVEQVLDAAPEIAALIARCPTLRILATSRVMLHISAETVVPVSPLAVPDVAERGALETLARADAIALFADRARVADAAFALTEDNVDAVVELVTRLDGLPLAIELAAARTSILPPDALLARMDRQLSLLTGGGRDAPERQQTMRNTIAWSYDLLTPTEQAIFRRLSIFRAGCTLEAAERVLRAAGDLSDIEILDGLTALVDSNLLRRRQPKGSPARFMMLATVREFGLEQLAAHREEEATREAAYRTWYLELASKAEPTTAPEGEARWLELLEQEHDNLRSALSWLTTRNRIEEALDFSGALWFFRWLRGHYAEAREQYESLLRHPLGQARTTSRARALIGLGVISLHQGDSERSLEALNEAIEITRESGNQWYLAEALMCSGNSYLRTGRIDEAEARTRECLAIAIEIGMRQMEESALGNLSVIASQRGQLDQARDLLNQLVVVARSIKETWGLALGLVHLGSYSLQDGDLDRAEAQVEEGIEMFIELKDKRDLPGAYVILARIARARGDLVKATSTLERALEIAQDMGDSLMIAQCLSGLGRLAYLAGNVDDAMRYSRQAAHVFVEIGDDVGAIDCLDLAADIAAAEGDMAHAAWCIGIVDRVHKERGIARTDPGPDEHTARVAAMIRAIGEPSWHKHWSAGHREDPEAALEIAFSPQKGAADAVDIGPDDERDAVARW